MTQPASTDERSKLYAQLLQAAREAAKQTYSPYSGFPVGAALLSKEGKIYTGCNVENRNYASSICAERTAFLKAISEGCRQFEIVAIAAPKSLDCWPCGFCRQFMSEFGGNLIVITEGSDGTVKTLTLDQLLPAADLLES